MTDWEIGNFAASGLDETSTYQMKEHCDHCAPFGMNKKIRPDPWDDSHEHSLHPDSSSVGGYPGLQQKITWQDSLDV